MSTSPLIRSARLADLPAILHIQARCYSAIVPESAASMGAKLAAAPDTCFVACRGEQIVAYLLALPWRFDAPPCLDATECHLPGQPDTLYLHDLAVDPAARGSGAADSLVQAFLSALARLPLPRASLIAIQGSAPWWARHGFARVPVDEALAARLAGYGEDAAYMARLTG
ncbi:GNAT family N-acetyltransferase [Zoogloea sp.]|uniref:GNAT family N-acetyltransferase n=1 Tax=Zoogloea sp. TaxID=49181 RepID=UPI0025EB31FD|nr:GNAT family N-acetyltransferase [Zoogloea sp.]MCK6395137.1 GNAT family N-acetyltransferase [Zoogloea sp.]